MTICAEATNVLAELEGLIGTAERKGQKASLEKSLAKAAEELKEAQDEVERTSKALGEARARLGKPDAIRIERIGKLEELRDKYRKYGEHLENRNDIEAKLKLAADNIESEWKDSVVLLSSLSEAVEKSQSKQNASIKRIEAIRAQADADSINDLEDFPVLPDLPINMIRDMNQEISRVYVDIVEWSSHERLAILKVIGGQARQLQDSRHLSEGEQKELRSVFSSLNELSAKYRPGYVHALDRDKVLDWGAYVDEAQQELIEAAATRERMARANEDRRRQAVEEAAKKAEVKSQAQAILVTLQELTAQERSAGTDEQIKDTVRVLLSEIGLDADDDTLLDAISGREDLFAVGNEFRSLRRQLERQGAALTAADLAKQFPKAVRVMSGKRAVIVGGVPREDRREKLEELFGLSSLEWVSGWKNEPRALECVCQRAKGGSIDFVIELASLCGHHVEAALKKACLGSSCRFVRVPKGYGASQIAQIVEQGL